VVSSPFPDTWLTLLSIPKRWNLTIFAASRIFSLPYDLLRRAASTTITVYSILLQLTTDCQRSETLEMAVSNHLRLLATATWRWLQCDHLTQATVEATKWTESWLLACIYTSSDGCIYHHANQTKSLRSNPFSNVCYDPRSMLKQGSGFSPGPGASWQGIAHTRSKTCAEVLGDITQAMQLP